MNHMVKDYYLLKVFNIFKSVLQFVSCHCVWKKAIQNNFTWLACARETIDHIPTYPIIHAWVTLAVIHISLAVCAHVAWKTEVFFFLELFYCF